MQESSTRYIYLLGGHKEKENDGSEGFVQYYRESTTANYDTTAKKKEGVNKIENRSVHILGPIPVYTRGPILFISPQ
jgi:hypothetical protein